jgi:hypothetical protein
MGFFKKETTLVERRIRKEPNVVENLKELGRKQEKQNGKNKNN